MLSQTSFIRKTKKGALMKVVKEHYLRDDLYCGVKICDSCPDHPSNLSDNPSMRLLNKSHYIIPDTNVILHQIDVLEHAAFKDVIILQIVLDEVSHKSSSVYERIRRLIDDPEKRFFVFCNEFHKETFVTRQPSESINDRNDRAIRQAAKWYQSHLPQRLSVVLLTNDKMNQRLAIQEGLQSFSVFKYSESIVEYPEILDLIAGSEDLETSVASFSYQEHLSVSQMNAGLKSGAFYQGTLTISLYNYLEGSIMIEMNGTATTVSILGRENLNRAIHGDIVVVELLPKTEWKYASEYAFDEEDSKLVQEDDDESKIEIDSVEKYLNRKSQDQELKPCGKIVGIIKRNWRPYCGTIDKSCSSSQGALSSVEYIYFWAIDRRIPKIRIRTRQASLLIGKRIVVAIDRWDKNSKHPMGHFVRVLGDVGDKATENEVLLLEYDIPFTPFSPKVLADLPVEGENWIVTDQHTAGRRDLRSLNVCSIDPPGCTDIDDALHIVRLDNGNYEVGVHIADVSHFVASGTAIDLEAQRRGTTVYLVDKRIDMLPSLLGTNLCSLRSNVDRLAFSCVWEITPDADIRNVAFFKSIIRSKASFTYEEAQARLEDPNSNDPISLGIKTLNSLAKKLRARRIQMGALTLASPEVRFKLENDSQDPIDVEMKEMKDANALVEEFMLLANISVARQIFSKFPESAVLRRHPQPPASNFDTLKKCLDEKGFVLDASSSKSLADSLDKMMVASDPYFNNLVRIMTTRCMMQAIYFSSGTIPQSDFKHYGLASDIYTHFTSPIRRYSDLRVHRLLAASIGYDLNYSPDLVDKVKTEEICKTLNYRHRNAQQASRSSVELYTNLFFKDKIVREEAYVIRVLRNGFAVIVPAYGIEGVVYSSNLESHSFQMKEGLRLEWDEFVIHLFDKVTVQISVEDAGRTSQRSKLVLKLVKPNIPGFSITE